MKAGSPPGERPATSATHPPFGTGVVMGVDGGELTVLFDDVGYKTLSLPTVVEQELLEPV